jgi:membrane protein
LLPSFTPERRRRLDLFRPTAHYLIQTEAHVYALAISASVLLSFFPFCNVMLSFCRNVLHWRAAEEAIYLALNDYFPGELAGFIRHNLPLRGDLHLGSMVLLLFTANGIFEPLEVALNRAWGATANRSYLRNQVVALGMIFACGALALLSVMLTALNRQWLGTWAGSTTSWLSLLLFKVAAVPISILALFLVYWLLPNRKVPPARVAPAAMAVGLVLEALKYVNLAVAPFLEAKLDHEYFIFKHSAMILLWSFVAAMVVLAGAEWTARGPLDPAPEIHPPDVPAQPAC